MKGRDLFIAAITLAGGPTSRRWTASTASGRARLLAVVAVIAGLVAYRYWRPATVTHAGAQAKTEAEFQRKGA